MLTGIPKELSDFKVWLNPRNLSSFNKLEVIKLANNAWKHESVTHNQGIIEALSRGLTNTEIDQGNFVLRMYFYQLNLDQPVNIDLRRNNFTYLNHWQFNSSKLTHHFNSGFRTALLETYKVFFGNGEGDLKTQLFHMGLLNETVSSFDQEKLLHMFTKHFGAGATEPLSFKFSHLLESFKNIFDFLGSLKIKIPSEFALLGFYLSTLYWNLEEAGYEYDIREAFELGVIASKLS